MKENELIKGKWYKRTDIIIEDVGSSWLTHVKILSINDDNDASNPIRYEECLYGGNTYKKEGICHCKQGYLELCPIEEIQQFLPEGHIDKIIKIPEKWCIRWSNEEIFEACKKYFNVSWGYCEGSFCLSNDNIYHHYWSYSEDKTPMDNGYTEITFEFFKQNILKEKDMKYTKQDWINGKCAIRWENNKAKEINKFFEDCVPSGNHAQGSHNYYFSTIERNEDWDCSNTTDLPIVTIDELLNNTNMRKIIGYLCPTDLFDGRIKIDTIFVKGTSNLRAESLYWPKNSNVDCLPKEIVEQWEPVYEQEFRIGDYIYIELANPGAYGINGNIGILMDKNTREDSGCEGMKVKVGNRVWGIGDTPRIRLATPEEIKSIQTKTITVGDKRILFTISKGKIEADGKTFIIQTWKDLYEEMNGKHSKLGGYYTVSFSEVKVGCTIIPLSDIELIINTYNQING